MKYFLLSFWLCGFAAAEICSPPINESTIQNHITFLQTNQFPELLQTQIKIENFTSDAYFLQANLKVKTVFKKPNRRTYVVEVNQKLYDCPPSPEGLQAILVHELQHVSDYLKWNSAEMMTFAAKYGMNKKFRTRYERHTDERTLLKGFGPGLIEYRIWIYQWLSPRELQNKKRYYFTPEEIEIWMEENQPSN